MSLQTYLTQKFENWIPSEPAVMKVSRQSVTLSWEQRKFSFVKDQLLYKIERKEKFPPWVTVYSGGKTATTIHELAPSTPFKFRLKIILRPSAVQELEKKALEFYGDEKSARHSQEYEESEIVESQITEEKGNGDKAFAVKKEYKEANGSKQLDTNKNEENISEKVTEVKKKNDYIIRLEHDNKNKDEPNTTMLESDINKNENSTKILDENCKKDIQNLDVTYITKSTRKPWLESQYSEETWTRTDSDGSSVISFYMSVRGGYIKQLQTMLDVRPELIELINPTNGLTPLITAVMRGELTTVRFLLTSGADVDQQSAAGHTPLHLALISARKDLVELLLDNGAKIENCDRNGLRAEHYSVESGCPVMVRLIKERGGDFRVTDSNGWTPLFRAVCQNASTELIGALLSVGSATNVTDSCGLHLTSAARLLVDSHGRSRESVLRMLDAQYPRELAQTHFTRLTKKINRIHTVFRL